MSLSTKRKWDYHTLVFIQVIFVLLGTPLFLFLDSPWVTPYFSYGQDTANVIMIGVYCWMFWIAKRKLHWLILLMTISSFFAEVIGSLILGLYQYRLHNIPLYIPLGHAIIYACIFHLANNPLIWRYHKALERYLINVAFLTVFMSLLMLRDVGGFLGYVLFLFILYTRQKKLFYLGMFAMVYYVELCGTVFSTWAWYGVVGNHPNLPPIGYTPSGAAGLYILIDLTSNSIYYYARKIVNFISLSKRRVVSIQPAT
ncbi:MAG: hypothetical protein P4L65_02325 [Legionella sp.]|nr:hypothetical protein [Legionella sp.]